MKRYSKTLTISLIMALGLLLTATAAQAHKVKIFAAAQGAEISGYAYFPGGGRIKNQPISARDAGGQTLAQTTTNAKGEFSLTAQKRVDHHLLLDLGDGHLARFVIRAAELPDNLPRPKGAQAPETTPAAKDTSAASLAPGLDRAKLTALIEAATAKAIRPLREELEGMRERIAIRDVIGGLGYIFGLMGLYIWYAARRKAKLKIEGQPCT